MPDTNHVILNASGFPFQMRIAQEIRDNPGRHNWELVAEEHPWSDAGSTQNGFIDILAGFGAVNMVVECKRGADATWLFLAQKNSNRTTETIHVLCTDIQENEPDIREWARMKLQPQTPVASFCAVRGQGEKEPMLERIASTLLLSTESLASEELKLAHQRRFRTYKFLIPAIVTTANLTICRLDPRDVDLENGKIDETKAEFESIEIVRFRKAFGVADSPMGESLEEVHLESERTVLVIHATKLVAFLSQMDLKPEQPWGDWPQNLIRARMRKSNQQKSVNEPRT